MRAWHYTPAADFGLAPGERVKCVRREAGLVASLLLRLFWALVRLYLRVWHRIRVQGLEKLPRETPFVLVANHTSHLDALVLGAFLPSRLRDRVYPISAGDTFFAKRSVGWFAALCLNALPLWRRKSCARALSELRERLAAGRCGYILFPEGTRARDGALAEFKPGLGMLVAGTSTPVIPCHIEGAFDAWPPGRRLPRPRRLTLRVGEALEFSPLPDERAGWEAAAVEAHHSVQKLAQRITCGGFPGARSPSRL